MIPQILLSLLLAVLYFTPKKSSSSSYDSETTTCNFTYTKFSSPYERLNLSMLNDEQQVWSLNLSCKPESFGYTPEEAERLFEDIDFPSCKKSSYKPSLLFQDNTLKMKCNGKYLLGPKSEELGRTEFTQGLSSYSNPVPLKTQEFAIGSCDKDAEGFFDQVVYRNVLNQKSLKRAKNSLKGEPLNIVMLVLDSVSRRSFYRKLPKTLKFLNEQQNPVHDFYVHNVQGEYSADSFMPSFMGDIRFYRLNSEDIQGGPRDDFMIFKYMHERGFVTYVATDDCGNDLAAYLGRKPEVDHKIASFFCAAEKYYNFENNAKKQRCIGPKNAHTYMLDYILDFSNNYQEVSRFSYVHLNTAHEGSGTVIKTLDDDLVSFLTDFWKLEGKKVLFLMGDHGMRYGSWFTQIDGSHEHRLPLFLVTMSEKMQEALPQSDGILHHNTKRLVSKLDIHIALKFLSSGTYNSSMICETSKRYRSYNIFLEQIPDNRNCIESGIPLFWCSCMPFIVSEKLRNSEKIKKITEEIIYELNTINLKPVTTLQTVCQPITLDKILTVKYQGAGWETYYNIKFNIQENDKVLFEALVLISKKKIRKREKDGFGSLPFYLDRKEYMKVMYIKRLDAYAGICQEVSEYKGIDPMFCVCKDFLDLKQTEKAMMDRIYRKRKLIVTDDKCEDACKEKKMSCDEFAWVLFKKCSAIPSKICGKCDKGEMGYSYVDRDKCYLDYSKGFSCAAKNNSSLCFCKKVD